jgi:hypothetical protein
MRTSWMKEQEMDQILFRENGDFDDLCYGHRPPHQPLIGDSVHECLKWVVTQVKNGFEKIKMKDKVI